MKKVLLGISMLSMLGNIEVSAAMQNPAALYDRSDIDMPATSAYTASGLSYNVPPKIIIPQYLNKPLKWLKSL